MKPVVATVSHTLGREAAKRRIAGSLDRIRAPLATVARGIEESWTGDRLDFRLTALDAMLQPGSNPTAAAINDAMKGHVKASAETVGVFAR